MLFNNFEKYLKRRKGAIHVGAHEGEERFWYVRQGFDNVIWFEPNITLFERLTKNTENLKGHVAYNYGVHDSLTTAELHISSNDGQSSSILPLKLHSLYHPDVKYISDQTIKVVRLDDFFKQNLLSPQDFNFLNIDVQGVELNVIKSFGEEIRNIDYIYTEINEDELYTDCCLVGDIDIHLKHYGFKRIATKMTKCKWGDALYVKNELL